MATMLAIVEVYDRRGHGTTDGTVSDMPKFSYEWQVSIRSAASVKRALDRVVADLKASERPGRLRFEGKKISKEAVVNAMYLWLAGQDVEDVERALAGPVAQLDALPDIPGVRDEGEGEGGSVGEPIDLVGDSPAGRPPRDEREQRG